MWYSLVMNQIPSDIDSFSYLSSEHVEGETNSLTLSQH